ncbi:MAG: tail fiber domain-containing protein [bacterium]
MKKKRIVISVILVLFTIIVCNSMVYACNEYTEKNECNDKNECNGKKGKVKFDYIVLPTTVYADSIVGLSVCLINQGDSGLVSYDCSDTDHVVISIPLGNNPDDLVNDTKDLFCSSQDPSWICDGPDIMENEIQFTLYPDGTVPVSKGETVCFTIDKAHVNSEIGLSFLEITENFYKYRADKSKDTQISVFKSYTPAIVETDPTVNKLGKATLSCADGQVAKWNKTKSTWQCADDMDTDTDTQLSQAEVNAYESDPTVNALAKTTLSCSDGQIVKWNNSTLAWECANDVDTDTQLAEAEVDSFVANNGYLTSITSNELDCLCSIDNKILKRVGGTWICADDVVGASGGEASYGSSSNAPDDALYVDDAGNVGIGTTNPSRKLEVVADDSGASSILLVNNQEGVGQGNYGGRIGFSRADIPGVRAQIASVQSGSDEDHIGLAFFVHPSNLAGDPTEEKLRIDHNGNVGIGTTSPKSKLEVAGTVTATAFVGDGSGLTNCPSTADNDWIISGNNIYSAASGNVGIGTTSPSEQLDVDGTVKAAAFNLNGDTITSWPVIQGGVWDESEGHVYRETGRVGIGTSSPFGILEITSPHIRPFLRLKNQGTGGVPWNWYSTNASYTQGAGKLLIHNDVVGNVAIFDQNGNFGIGTTNPGEKLEVAGKIKVVSQFPEPQVTISSDADALFKANADNDNFSGGRISFQFGATENNSARGSFRGFTIRDVSSSQNRFFIDPAGNVGIGMTSPSSKLHVAGDALANNWNTSSDKRLKKNVTPIENALTKVSALNGVMFEWRTEEYPEKKLDEGKGIGLIAQEVEEVLPEVVSEDAEGYKSIDYSKLTPLLIEAIKVQQAYIEAVKVENETLKTVNNGLREEIERIKQALGL